jgi:hypothetical protein
VVLLATQKFFEEIEGWNRSWEWNGVPPESMKKTTTDPSSLRSSG